VTADGEDAAAMQGSEHREQEVEGQDVLEGLRLLRDALRLALGQIMPLDCPESRSFRPLLRDLELTLAAREPTRPDQRGLPR
jgi:hypothetical protein